MSSPPPSSDRTAERNPYRPPSTDLSAEVSPVLDDAQCASPACTRRAQAIKALSWLNFLLAFAWLPAAAGTTLLAVSAVLGKLGVRLVPLVFPGKAPPEGWELVGLTIFHVGCLFLNVAVGIGLRRLRPWARWAEAVVTVVILVALIGRTIKAVLPATAVTIGVLYTLFSPPSSVVFSPQKQGSG